jgi:4-amino-4-deoxy-L-arabinose transferase-like glycosyltransferase
MPTKDKLIAFGIFIFAVIVASIYIYSSPEFPSKECFNLDGVDYDTIALNLFLGNGYCHIKGVPTSFRPPLYPLFLASIYSIFGYDHTPVKYIQAILHGFTAMLTFVIGFYCFGRITGLLAASYISVYEPFLYINTLILSEPLFITLTLLTLYFVIMILNRGEKSIYAVLLGFISGIATLCRTALAPFILILFPLLLFIKKLTDKKIDLKQYGKIVSNNSWLSLLKKYLLTLVIFFITLSPWAIRNYNVHGRFLITDTHGGWVFWQKLIPFHNFGNNLDNAYKKAQEKGLENTKSEELFRWVFEDNLFGVEATYYLMNREYPGNNIPKDEIMINDFYYSKASEYMKEHPFLTMLNIFKNGVKFYSPIISTEGFENNYSYWYSFIFIFGIIGLICSFPLWRQSLPLYFVIMNFTTIVSLSMSHDRFRYPIDPIISIFAAFGIINICNKSRNKIIALIVFLVIIVLNILIAQFCMNIKLFLKNLL